MTRTLLASPWSRVSQTKNKVSTFFNIFGQIHFGEDLPWTFSKSETIHFASFWLGVWWIKQNQVWGVTFVLWFGPRRVANSDPISFGKSGFLHSISAVSKWILLKSMKKQHKFLAKLSTERGKFILWVSPPNQNRTGLFKQGTSCLSRTLQLVKTTKVFRTNWLFFVDCFVCLIEKPCKALWEELREWGWEVMRLVDTPFYSGCSMVKTAQPHFITKRSTCSKPHLFLKRE